MKAFKQIRYLFLTVIIVITSCSKDKTKTVVTGKVIDATTASALIGATVFLKAANPDCFSCQGSTIQTTTTDALGDFAFNFTHNSDLIYNVEASQSNYFSSANGGVSLKKGDENTAILSLRPEAFMRLFIENTNPFDGNDKLGLAVLGGGYSFYGMTVDTSIVKIVLGNQNNPIAWGVTKNNIQTSYNTNVYCTAFDTTNYTINY